MLDKNIDLDFPWESTVHPCYEIKILPNEEKVQFLLNKKIAKTFTLASFEKAASISSPDEVGVILSFLRKNGVEITKKVFRLKEAANNG